MYDYIFVFFRDYNVKFFWGYKFVVIFVLLKKKEKKLYIWKEKEKYWLV